MSSSLSSSIATQDAFAPIYRMAGQESAVSAEANAVRTLAGGLIDSVEQSAALFGNKARAISELWQIFNECSTDDWDGYSARAIELFSVYNAIAFIRSLPSAIAMPETGPDLDGSILLDWHKTRSRLFSVNVGPTSRVSYAWLDGTDRGHGAADFDGRQVPVRILSDIQFMAEHATVAFWTKR